VAGRDHDARHGDRYERRTAATLAQVQAFLDGTIEVDFAAPAAERYEFIARTVRRFGYGRLKRTEKAALLRFLERVSGYSRQQISRLVKRGGERRPLLKRYRGSRTSFARTYTSADVLLLAHTDNQRKSLWDTLHRTLSEMSRPNAHHRADRRPACGAAHHRAPGTVAARCDGALAAVASRGMAFEQRPANDVPPRSRHRVTKAWGQATLELDAASSSLGLSRRPQAGPRGKERD